MINTISCISEQFKAIINGIIDIKAPISGDGFKIIKSSTQSKTFDNLRNFMKSFIFLMRIDLHDVKLLIIESNFKYEAKCNCDNCHNESVETSLRLSKIEI